MKLYLFGSIYVVNKILWGSNDGMLMKIHQELFSLQVNECKVNFNSIYKASFITVENYYVTIIIHAHTFISHSMIDTALPGLVSSTRSSYICNGNQKCKNITARGTS